MDTQLLLKTWTDSEVSMKSTDFRIIQESQDSTLYLLLHSAVYFCCIMGRLLSDSLDNTGTTRQHNFIILFAAFHSVFLLHYGKVTKKHATVIHSLQSS